MKPQIREDRDDAKVKNSVLVDGIHIAALTRGIL